MEGTGKIDIPDDEEYFRKQYNDVCPICHGSGWELFYDKKGRTFAHDCPCGLRGKAIATARAKREQAETDKEIKKAGGYKK